MSRKESLHPAAGRETMVMEALVEAFLRPAAHSYLMTLCKELRTELFHGPNHLKSTQSPVPLDVYHGLPPDVRSSWVFVLREGLRHPAERHPNSIQRMFALDCGGAMEVWEHHHWVRYDLMPGAQENRLSIPARVWHRPAELLQPWGVVSFHTVPARSLIEEIGDPELGHVGAARHYL